MFASTTENLLKNRTFHVVCYFTWKVKLASNILWMSVVVTLHFVKSHGILTTIFISLISNPDLSMISALRAWFILGFVLPRIFILFVKTNSFELLWDHIQNCKRQHYSWEPALERVSEKSFHSIFSKLLVMILFIIDPCRGLMLVSLSLHPNPMGKDSHCFKVLIMSPIYTKSP